MKKAGRGKKKGSTIHHAAKKFKGENVTTKGPSAATASSLDVLNSNLAYFETAAQLAD